ncbi:hypothetical protein ACJIZ3_001794 [Penstemon smallii]|uniref:Uncharacterized protein n=1 Tax=Penstemon smallii TaxID=265156 RepID=A0ABD3U635_9LAMI
MFLETQVGPILDHVEELVEEHNLDPLVSMKSSVGETAQSLSEAKKKELQYLTGLLRKAEEQKRNLSERLELLKKEKKDISGAADLVHELRTGILNFQTGHHTRFVNI